MKFAREWVFLVFFLSATINTVAQDTLFRPVDTVIIPRKTHIKIYHFSILPHDFRVSDSAGHFLPLQAFAMDFVKADFLLKDTSYLNRPLHFHFLTYPEKWIYPKGRPLVINEPENDNWKKYSPSHGDDFFDGLEAKGFFSRGVLTGNNMNASSVSKLDLRLKGKLSGKVAIDAHIYDDNAPYGYEGVTTTFNDINRMFIRISGPGWRISAGDSLWQFRNPLFAFSRQNKGIGIDGNTGGFEGGIHVAAVKGKYAENKFTLVKGSYGPFPLTVDHRRMIYIVHGSEEVFLNGKKLERDKEYIIHYETAEIVLQPVLEFESYDFLTVKFKYANQNYQRWSSFQKGVYRAGHHTWDFFHFNETDVKTKPLLFMLDSATVDAMRRLSGEDTLKVLAAVPVDFDPEKVLYKKVPLPDGFYFEYTPAPVSDTVFEVRFTYTGKNTGEYILDHYVARGPVFKFVGRGNGDYSPWFRPPLPVNTHYTGAGWRFENKKWQWRIYQAVRSCNPNTFGTEGFTHSGASYMQGKYFLKNDSMKKWTMQVRTRYFSPQYRLTDRVDPVAFTDKWQIPPEIFMQPHTFFSFASDYSAREKKWHAGWEHLKSGDIALQRMEWNHTLKWKKWQWKAQNSRTQGRVGEDYSVYEFYEHQWRLAGKKWQPVWEMAFRNQTRRKDELPDSLSYRFYRWKNFVELKKESGSWRSGYHFLLTDSVHSGAFKRAVFERGIFMSHSKSRGDGHREFRLEWLNDKYASRRNKWALWWSGEKRFPGQKGKISWHIAKFGGMMRKYEIIYTRVPDGQGQFQWVDYNNNGIAEQDEFEPAYYSDQANYIRVVLPSHSYIPSTTTEWQLHVLFNPGNWWHDAAFLKKWQWILDAASKNQTYASVPQMQTLFPGARTLDGNYRLNSQVRFDMTRRIALRYILQLNGQTQNLYDGLVRTFLRKHEWRLQWNGQAGWKWEPVFTNVYLSRFSAIYPAKNYFIQHYAVHTPVKYQTKLWHISWDAGWDKKESARLTLWQKNLRFTWKYTRERRMAGGEIRFVQNDFRGNNLTPAAFVMLEGLTPGKNWIGRLNVSWFITKTVSVEVLYEMRKSGTAPFIHTARFALNAKFD